MFHLIEHICLG